MTPFHIETIIEEDAVFLTSNDWKTDAILLKSSLSEIEYSTPSRTTQCSQKSYSIGGEFNLVSRCCDFYCLSTSFYIETDI
jgi:hypothetical protein